MVNGCKLSWRLQHASRRKSSHRVIVRKPIVREVAEKCCDIVNEKRVKQPSDSFYVGKKKGPVERNPIRSISQS